jgi:nitrite reductase/ring-hydroxylating ferredoxin subunit
VRFNLETGEPVGQLTKKPIKTYTLEEKGDLLKLRIRTQL